MLLAEADEDEAGIGSASISLPDVLEGLVEDVGFTSAGPGGALTKRDSELIFLITTFLYDRTNFRTGSALPP